MTINDGRSWSLADDQPVQLLREQGFVLLSAPALARAIGAEPGFGQPWAPSWQRLATDTYLKDGGHYRRRRHSCFVSDEARATITQTPHRPHWQSTDYNALHGGIDRLFEPMEPAIAGDRDWLLLLQGLGHVFTQAARAPVRQWFVEAHQFRIDTAEGVGRPTPEGAHRDGVDFVAVVLIGRHHVKGGETRVFDANGPAGMRFVMREPFSALLLDDRRMIHEATPIQPDGDNGHRDTLVLTYRSDGFQQSGLGSEASQASTRANAGQR